MTKYVKKFTVETKFIIFLSKIAIYLSLGLHKGRPSYRSRLQHSKRTSGTSKHEFFLFLWIIFALLDPDPATPLAHIRVNPDSKPYIMPNKLTTVIDN